MNQDYLKSWTAIINEMQKPFQAMIESNVKMLQNLPLLKPEEFSDWQKPSTFLDKQVKCAMENSHKTLDYMKQSFQIFENAVLSFSKEMSVKNIQTYEKTSIPIVKKVASVARKAVPTTKKTASATKKVALAARKTTPVVKTPVAKKK